MPAVVANLTPASPNCSAGASGTSCAFVVPAYAGADTFGVTAYDALDAVGNKLSPGTPVATINAAQLATLASGGFMDAGEPIVLLGDSGTGKTHYADLRLMPI